MFVFNVADGNDDADVDDDDDADVEGTDSDVKPNPGLTATDDLRRKRRNIQNILKHTKLKNCITHLPIMSHMTFD